jgi:hypothetical protein
MPYPRVRGLVCGSRLWESSPGGWVKKGVLCGAYGPGDLWFMCKKSLL